jgi:hypothetical protein
MREWVLQFLVLASAGLDSATANISGVITGRVYDAKTQEPLIGVNIVLLDLNTGAATDSQGRFRLPKLPAGTYRLQFTYLGYEPVVRTDVVVTNARPEFLQVPMMVSSLLTESVVVTQGYFDRQTESSPSSTRLSREEIRRFPGGFEDVVRTVATLPGVAVVNEGGRNDLIVRGGGPSENLYVINGIEVPNINHFGSQGSSSGALSFVNLDFIDAVDFSTGGFGVRYGDKMSSLLSIDLRPGRADRVGGKATISATQFGANVEGPISDDGNFLFSARESYLDLIFKALDQPFVPVYTDLNLIAEYTPAEKSRLTLLALLAFDRVSRNQSSEENRVKNADVLDNTQTQAITGLVYRHFLKDGFVDASLNVNQNRFRLSQEDPSQSEYFNSRADETEFVLKVDSHLNASPSNGLHFGVSSRTIMNNNNTVFADTVYDRSGRRIAVSDLGIPEVIDQSLTTQQFGAYAELDQTLWSRASLRVGLRADHYGFIDRSFYAAPRLSINLRANSRLSFKTGLGRYFQSPSYVWTVNDFNRNLTAMRNDMAIVGLDWLVRSDLNASIEFYHKRYSDLPTGAAAGDTDYLVLTNTGVGYGGREDDFRSFGYFDLVSEGTGRAFGFELLLQKKYSDTPLYGQVSFGFGKSEVTAGNGLTYPGQFDQRFILNIAGGYKFNSKWEISGKFRFFTGAPFTPVYRPSENGGTTQNLPQEYLSSRLDPAHILDLRVDRRFNFSGWTMILFLDIQNLYNNKYQVRPEYDFWDDRVEDTNPIGLLPSIGLSAEF